jgi:putative DNA-invertase from lambdoid prophage Rac
MRVAIYARVSTDEQTEQNQVPILEKWALDRGWTLVSTYRETGSAWQHADQKELRRLAGDCRQGLAEAVLVYDLSRLTRGGPLATLQVIRQLSDVGARVMSYRDSWIEQFTHPSLRDALIGFLGFVNEDESRRISDRTKAGMARARAEGKHIGRPKKRVLPTMNTLSSVDDGNGPQ